MTEGPLRIAMWSGPRNISTAMMRAFENRPDCTVSDEPLYGAWLEMTGADHPMREEVIAAMEIDWRKVVANLTGPVPDDRPVWYQKHMTHHLLPEMLRHEWMSKLTHTFLIRDPARVVVSYLKKRGTVSPEDIGIPQQTKVYEGHLRMLCERLGLEFTRAMLSWPAGPRDSDGPWAPHWYRNVWRSTGFQSPPKAAPRVAGRAREVVSACRSDYERLYRERLRVGRCP